MQIWISGARQGADPTLRCKHTGSGSEIWLTVWLGVVASIIYIITSMKQWGFTALHYATVARSKDVVMFLLANGASAITLSKVSMPFMQCSLVTFMNGSSLL